ncbi:MAG TPA: glycosyltransferase 87 family protein [Terriglobales bacterium]
MATSFRSGWKWDETDFPNYYTAAVLVRKHQPLRNYYDWTWFQRQMSYAGIERFGAYTPQTPLTMLPMVGLTAFPPQGAKRIWLLFNLGFLALTIWAVSRVSFLRWELVALLALCGYGSLNTNFLYGQYYVFLLFLLTFTFFLLQRNSASAGGFLAGVAFGLKLYGGPYLLMFIVKRKWKAAAGMAVAIALLAITAVSIFGWRDIWFYMTQILPRTLEGGSVDPYHPGNPGISTLLRHLFVIEPELNPFPVWDAPWLFFFLRSFSALAIVAFTLLGLTQNSATSMHRDFAWFTIMILLLSTSVASYTFILLFLPTVLLLEDASPRQSVFLVVFYFLLTFPIGFAWLFPKVWLLLTLFIVVGLHYWRSISRRLALSVAVSVMIVAAADAALHTKRYLEEPGRRFEHIAVEKGAMFSSYPVVTDAGIFYQSMGKNRYVLRRLKDGVITEFSFPGHALHPRVDDPRTSITFELLARGVSTPTKLDVSTGDTSPLSAPVATADPLEVTSPDGRWVAIVSSANGPEQIWLRNVASGKTAQLAGGSCNSYSPAWELDSKAVIFASDCDRAYGLPALFRAPVPVQNWK